VTIEHSARGNDHNIYHDGEILLSVSEADDEVCVYAPDRDEPVAVFDLDGTLTSTPPLTEEHRDAILEAVEPQNHAYNVPDALAMATSNVASVLVEWDPEHRSEEADE